MNTGDEPLEPAEPPQGDGHTATPDHRVHGSTGRYITTLAHNERAAAAARLKADNPRMTYQQIADAVGYSDRGDAWRAIDKCRKAVLQQAGAELIASEAALLDDQFVSAMEILDRDHVMVSHGKVVKDDDGNPLLDDGPRLAALREMREIRHSYRKLLGVDAAQKINVDGAVRYEVVGISPEDLT